MILRREKVDDARSVSDIQRTLASVVSPPGCCCPGVFPKMSRHNPALPPVPRSATLLGRSHVAAISLPSPCHFRFRVTDCLVHALRRHNRSHVFTTVGKLQVRSRLSERTYVTRSMAALMNPSDMFMGWNTWTAPLPHEWQSCSLPGLGADGSCYIMR